MKRDPQGHYVTISTVSERVEAFVPFPLPPKPPIEWTPELRGKFDEALLVLGSVNIAGSPGVNGATDRHCKVVGGKDRHHPGYGQQLSR